MHIIYTTKIYLPHIGGVELYIKKLADYFVAKGNSVTVITADEEISRFTEEYDGSIKIMRIPAKSVGGVFFLKHKSDFARIKQELTNADIVHVNDCKFLFRFFAKQKRKICYKLICSSHGWLFHTKNHSFLKRVYFKEFVAKNARYYDRIICVSEQDKRIAESYGIKNLGLILPGMNLKKYAELPASQMMGYYFFYWGRISSNKGILEALKKLSRLTVDWHFSIAGKCEDDEYMSNLKTYIINHDMEKRISFLGILSDEDIRMQISNCNFILMPSLHEGFGATLVECLLSNRPILANKIESFEKILEQTQATEYLFDFEDEKSDLQTKITELQNKKIVPKNVEQFSEEKLMENIENVYEELLR